MLMEAVDRFLRCEGRVVLEVEVVLRVALRCHRSNRLVLRSEIDWSCCEVGRCRFAIDCFCGKEVEGELFWTEGRSLRQEAEVIELAHQLGLE